MSDKHVFCFLVELDGKAINELSRQFLLNWKASKDARKKMQEERLMAAQMAGKKWVQTNCCGARTHSERELQHWHTQRNIREEIHLKLACRFIAMSSSFLVFNLQFYL